MFSYILHPIVCHISLKVSALNMSTFYRVEPQIPRPSLTDSIGAAHPLILDEVPLYADIIGAQKDLLSYTAGEGLAS